MAEMSAEDEGLRELVFELEAQSIRQAQTAVRRAGDFMREKVIEKLTDGKRSGKIYYVPSQKRIAEGQTRRKARKNPRTYQASAPNEPPAVMRGKLAQNINRSKVEREGDEVRVWIGVDLAKVPYARRLEFGGVDKRGVNIEKRPYLRPTFLEQESAIDQILQRELSNEVG
jgi:hypothetical protein